MTDNDKNNDPINWAGVSTILGAGIGSVVGLNADHIILYTLMGAFLGLWLGTWITNRQRSKKD